MEDILSKSKITMKELCDYYRANYPYEPNDQRVGRFAKSIGLKHVKQMVDGKLIRFYVKASNS
jgi:hypothetical protein